LKFIVDGMLGKLSRWLRMLGYDVEYFNNMDDDQLTKVASEEKRILLTRDYQLYRKASVHGVEAFLVEGQTEAERLVRLVERFNVRLEIDVANSRCPKCNTKITPVSKEEVKDRVPSSTFRFYNDFWICPNCKQVYWRGSHWEKINNTLIQARQWSLLMKTKVGDSL